MLKDRENYYIELIKNSNSLCEVCKKAGIVHTTGNYKTLKKIILENDIDISHFKRNGGAYVKPRAIEEYLVKGSQITSYKLKNKLFLAGLKEKRCECCGNTEWMGKPINLELHHKNGDPRDNRIENLEILCPNCHSYTDTYSGKNQKMNIREKEERSKRKPKKEKTVKRVEMKKEKTVKRAKMKKERKGKLDGYTINKFLADFSECNSFVGVGKMNGVSDNGIRRWCKRNGLPTKIFDLREIVRNLKEKAQMEMA